jgi:hypothetical protein
MKMRERERAVNFRPAQAENYKQLILDLHKTLESRTRFQMTMLHKNHPIQAVSVLLFELE